MVLDTSIIAGIQQADPLASFLKGSETRKQIERQDALAPIQQQQAEQNLEGSRLKNMSAREKAAIENVVIGAERLGGIIGGDYRTALESGSIDEGLQFLNTRRANLQEQQALGMPVDTQETTRAIDLLTAAKQGDQAAYDRLVGSVERYRNFGRRAGVLGRGQNIPADVQFANELRSARADGDIQRLNDLLFSRKIQKLEAGQTIDSATGQISTAPGFGESVRGISEQKQLGKGLADIQTKPKIEEGKKEVERVADLKAKLPKAQNALTSTLAKYSSVKDTIQRAFPLVQSLNASFGSESLAKVPGSGAADLRALLDTIGANLAFNELGEMRSNSPTGGALGQVTERELALLQATKQNITATQSVGQLRENLLRLYKDLEAGEGRLQDAFGNEFGELTQPQGGAKDEFQDLGNGIKIRFK